jgi:hypothetical protein
LKKLDDGKSYYWIDLCAPGHDHEFVEVKEWGSKWWKFISLCSKNMHHGSKILEDSKVFLDKSQAQQFCDSLNAEPSDWWEDNEHYFVKEMLISE